MSVPVTSKNNKRFVSGVILLTLSNILVKIIGLVLKIPLHGILGDNGMAYYTAAYEIYVWFYQISTAGLPVAISIMISEHRANGNPVQIRRVFRIALGMFVGVGLAGTAIMLLGAKGFAGLYGLPNASYVIMAIAPTLFFVCVSSAVWGFFQGH